MTSPNDGVATTAPCFVRMSLRAYFAGLAMQATIPENYHMSAVGTRWLDPGTAAKEAVDAADALIAALEVKHE